MGSALEGLQRRRPGHGQLVAAPICSTACVMPCRAGLGKAAQNPRPRRRYGAILFAARRWLGLRSKAHWWRRIGDAGQRGDDRWPTAVAATATRPPRCRFSPDTGFHRPHRSSRRRPSQNRTTRHDQYCSVRWRDPTRGVPADCRQDSRLPASTRTVGNGWPGR